MRLHFQVSVLIILFFNKKSLGAKNAYVKVARNGEIKRNNFLRSGSPIWRIKIW